MYPHTSIDLKISGGLLMKARLWPDPSDSCKAEEALLLPAQLLEMKLDYREQNLPYSFQPLHRVRQELWEEENAFANKMLSLFCHNHLWS